MRRKIAFIEERPVCTRGIGDRLIEALEQQGYRTPEDLVKETEDKLAVKSGLGIKKARAIRQGAQQYLELEQRVRAEAKG